MSAKKCQNCGSTDIESDATRADSVCTGCGTVLESGIIVSDVQFEENAHGGSSAIGTFVSADRKGGGGNNFGGAFNSGVGRESREITLKNARKKIQALAQQLRLRPDHIDMAFYFFKLALAKHLTRGRKSTHVIAACVYITCRTEGTSHMLIDFSDILQVDVYELGRTYLRLSQALCINIPAMDPCLYVMRFAHKLEFGEKTHEVSMTALRLVSRMKKDWIHFGRRPSGLCGAALLIASRLHDFCRTVNDVIKVVKVHESTLRKRLNEFGETPASQLTLDEFMNVDLDAMTDEQDPPSYKAARKKDRERLEVMELETDIDGELSELEERIERGLEERRAKVRGPYARLAAKSSSSDDTDGEERRTSTSGSESEGEKEREADDITKFIHEQTLGVISECFESRSAVSASQAELDSLLMPPPGGPAARHVSSLPCAPGLGLKDTVQEYLQPAAVGDVKVQGQEETLEEKEEELDLTGIDEDEIDSYIMTAAEIKQKTTLWLRVNAEYLEEQALKIKREEEEREEMIRLGKDPDKKKKSYRKKQNRNLGQNGTALEAIEKVVQERKISTKINYDVLKNLTMGVSGGSNNGIEGPEGGSSNGDSTAATLSPKNEPHAGTERAVKGEKEDEGGSLNVSKSRGEPAAKRPRQHSQGPNLLVRGGGRVNNQSKQKQVVLGELGGEEKRGENKSGTESETSSAVDEPVVEEGPVEPEAQEEDLSDLEDDEDDRMLSAAELLGGYGEEEEEEYY